MRLLHFLLLFLSLPALAQQGLLTGSVVDQSGAGLAYVSIGVESKSQGTLTDEAGSFSLELPTGEYTVLVSALSYAPRRLSVAVTEAGPPPLEIVLESSAALLEGVVVTGTMKAVSRANSPVPVEVYTASYFRANPSPSVFESLQTVNGVRPQLNCAVCNTGDIHINGMEGPYTMVLIDGMPVVSGLSTVYGLSGIPQSLIERVEVVKGPASTLYGSEAVGGLINVITKDPADAPLASADLMASSWGEVNLDLGMKARTGSAHSLLGVNYFNFQNPVDNNGDGFTDATLQDRISVFNKWSFNRNGDRPFTLAGRYVYEDRFGGQLDWDRGDRGGDRVYGESITTNRWETFGTYRLPTAEAITFQFSANGHYHHSAYGTTLFDATQYVGFGQLTWNKSLGDHDLLLGAAYRYTWYEDNTPVSAAGPSRTSLPGAFIQDELRLSPASVLLLGLRYDYNSYHGSILTPRLNYKWNSESNRDVVRLSLGNGYRVANVFTEDHAALTGAREVRFAETLRPETSWNGNANYTRKFLLPRGVVIGLDGSAWYTRFGNRILPDYTSDPNAIIYANLRGTAVSRGLSLSGDLSLRGGATLNAGLTLQDVYTREEGGPRERQLLTESFSGVWQLSVPIPAALLKFDYTGNVYGPMELPLLGELDDRPGRSPWFSTQNIQVTKTFLSGLEVYGGIKNLLNFTPPANSIARAFDPFDRGVAYAADGSVRATADNPRALSFDPTYVYASNQGRRAYLGVRWSLLK